MEEGERITAVLARVGSRAVAVRASDVLETLRPLPIEPVPEAPRFVRGVALVRGAAAPLVSLAALLGEPCEARGERWILVRAGARAVALEVDAVIAVREIARDALRDLPPLVREAGGGPLAALGALDGRLLSVLDAARIVPEEVLTALANR